MRPYFLCLPVVFSSLLWLGACSDDDAPPDDDNSGGTTDSAGGEDGGPQAGSSLGGAPAVGGSRPTGGTAGTAGTAGSSDEGDGGRDGGGTAGAPTSHAPRGACDISERVGRFAIEKQKDYGVVTGTILEGVVPTSVPELIAEQDGCKVYKRRNLSCSPACIGAETCGEDGSCIPYPRQVNVGTITVEGLTKPTTMKPQKPGAVYFAPGADNPPFELGSDIVLSAAGTEEQPAFQLFGVGSEPLLEGPEWLLEEGQDLALEWPAPPADAVAATHIGVELTIDQHGNSPLSLSCVFDDTGTAAIPAELIDELINSGVSGFPNGRIVRHTVDKVELDVGCVELVVGSAFSASVNVDGFTPCTMPSDCPDGQTCNVTLERCE